MLNTENHHLIMCEIYNSFIHGQHFLKEYETEDVDGHYLVYCKFDFQKEKNIWKNIRKTEIWLSNVYKNIIEQQQMKINHDFIRNYKNIIQRGCRPEIAKIIYLQGGECIAILKTFWLRIIQRKWKKTFLKRTQIIQQRYLPNSLKTYWETGKWPIELRILPGINGLMLDSC